MDENIKSQVQQIRNLPLFMRLKEQDIEMMLRQGRVLRVLRFGKGEAIIHENRIDRKIYLTIKGKVLICKEVVSGDSRRSQSLVTLEGRDHFLGEIAALTGKPRTASVLAVEETVCLMVDMEELTHADSAVLERLKASFYPGLFDVLCKRLAEADDTMVALKRKNAELETLLSQARQEKIALKRDFQLDAAAKNQQIAMLEEKLERLASRGGG